MAIAGAIAWLVVVGKRGETGGSALRVLQVSTSNNPTKHRRAASIASGTRPSRGADVIADLEPNEPSATTVKGATQANPPSGAANRQRLLTASPTMSRLDREGARPRPEIASTRTRAVPRAGRCTTDPLAIHLVEFVKAEGKPVPVRYVYQQLHESAGGRTLSKADRSNFNKAMSRALSGKDIQLVGPTKEGYIHRSVAPRRR